MTDFTKLDLWGTRPCVISRKIYAGGTHQIDPIAAARHEATRAVVAGAAVVALLVLGAVLGKAVGL